MTLANPAAREESNRSRRRRRRGGGGGGGGGGGSGASVGGGTRNEFDQQQQANNNAQPSLPPSSRSSSRRPYISSSQSTTTTNNSNSTSNNRRVASTSSPPRPPPLPKPSAEQLAREKEAREKEEREKEKREQEEREKEAREKEAKEEAQRLAQLAELSARRAEERLKNIPFCMTFRSPDDANASVSSNHQQSNTILNSQHQPASQQQQQQQHLQQLVSQPSSHPSESSSQTAKNQSLHQQQQQQQRPSDAQLRQLDSSVKKCTGFIRKVRAMGVNEESVNSLVTEAHSLNLSRYISEVVSAMAESKLRSGDVAHFVTLAGHLHRRYEEFAPELISILMNVITIVSPNPRDLPSRKAAMRILVEMFIVAIYDDINQIVNVLRQLMRSTSRDSKDENLNSLSIVSSFVRAATRCIISPPPSSKTPSSTVSPLEKTPPSASKQSYCELMPNASEAPDRDADEDHGTANATSWEDDVVPLATKVSIVSALQTYFDNDVSRLVKEASEELQKTGEAVARVKQVRDTPDDATASAFESAKQFCEKAVSAANVIAEALDKSAYSTPSDSPTSFEGSGVIDPTQVFVANSFSYVSKNRNANQDLDVLQSADHPFESDEQRMFYTELIEVKSLIPSNKSSEKGGEKKGEGGDRASSNREGRRKGSERAANMERLLNKLPSIETKDAADAFVQQYVLSKEGSRVGTKRLAKALFTVSPQKLNVLPAYARIAATLQPLYGGEITSIVSTSLQEDFHFYAGKAEIDEKTLALCIKCSNYIGEYVKFGIVSITTMLELVSICMKDLSGHRIDAVCHLLESCGRYVYRTVQVRMSNILETLWRVKAVRNLEARHNTLIENAYYAVKLSSGGKAQKVKTRPPIHEYIRHLIYYRLDAANVTWTRNQLLKLPWDDDLEFYVMKKFVKISRARYSTIPHVAALIFALQKPKQNLVIGIIDMLLEFIRSGIEKNDGRDSQRRLAEVYLFGEMYKCGVVSEQLVYNVLYMIITLGHDDTRSDPASPDVEPTSDEVNQQSQTQSGRLLNGTNANNSVPDPAGDFFRIRLACVMLESCGRVLVRSNRRSFEIFLAYLERYLFCKTYQAGLADRVPLHIEYMLDDVLDGIIMSNRRVARDARSVGRSGSRGEKAYLNHSGSGESQWQTALTRSFHRNKSFEQALTAVHQIEQSTDSALINMPLLRVIDKTHDPDSKPSSGNAVNGISHAIKDETSGRATKNNLSRIRGIENGSSRMHEDQEEDYLSSDGAIYGENEPMVMDDDDLQSGDDEDMILGRPYNGVDQANEFDVEVDNEFGNDEMDDVDVDEEDEDDLDDDEDEDDEDEEDDEDDVLIRNSPRTEEEDAFAKELAAFTAEEVQNARASNPRIARLDRMVIPMSLMSKHLEEKRAAEAAQAVNGPGESDEWSDEDEDEDEEAKLPRRRKHDEDEEAVEFKVLIRKGGKSQLAELQVPATSSIAVAAKESETADIARHEETKRLVLGSSIVQNDGYGDDFEDEIPMQIELHNAREKEENIRQQRITDEHELLATLSLRNRPRR